MRSIIDYGESESELDRQLPCANATQSMHCKMRQSLSAQHLIKEKSMNLMNSSINLKLGLKTKFKVYVCDKCHIIEAEYSMRGLELL